MTKLLQFATSSQRVGVSSAALLNDPALRNTNRYYFHRTRVTYPFCPRKCGVNRLKGEKGFCRALVKSVIFSYHPHFGEEMSLVGGNGSGTIFFSNCNLRCVFCQNWPISHEGRGKEIQDEDLANMMIELQKIGCHNINLVTPTHVMPNILNATRIAFHKGLRLPLVYNTSGYEGLETLKVLDRSSSLANRVTS